MLCKCIEISIQKIYKYLPFLAILVHYCPLWSPGNDTERESRYIEHKIMKSMILLLVYKEQKKS